jgi:hypothetical protein
MSSLTSQLFRVARKAGRRVKNIAVGRAFSSAGVWRRLWR